MGNKPHPFHMKYIIEGVVTFLLGLGFAGILISLIWHFGGIRSLGRERELRAQMAQIAQDRARIERARLNLGGVGGADAAATAEKLARHVLGPKAFDQLKTNGFLDVSSTHHHLITYRIEHLGKVYSPQVHVMKDSNLGTYRAGSLCILPLDNGNLPAFDQFLTIYLIAKHDERRLLQVGIYSGEDLGGWFRSQ